MSFYLTKALFCLTKVPFLIISTLPSPPWKNMNTSYALNTALSVEIFTLSRRWRKLTSNHRSVHMAILPYKYLSKTKNTYHNTESAVQGISLKRKKIFVPNFFGFRFYKSLWWFKSTANSNIRKLTNHGTQIVLLWTQTCQPLKVKNQEIFV